MLDLMVRLLGLGCGCDRCAHVAVTACVLQLDRVPSVVKTAVCAAGRV